MALTPLTNTQVVALQLEKVRKKLPVLYERADTLFSVISKREVQKVSTRSARIPLQVKPGGAFGAFSADGGDMGRGSGTSYDVATITPVGLRIATEINKLVEYASDTSEKAVANAAKTEVANAMKEFRRDLDMMLQTAGNGVIGNLAASGSNVGTTTWTLTATPFGARLLRPGMKVQVYSSNLATNRVTGAAPVISSVQNSLGATQTVVVDSIAGLTGAVDGDVIVIDGLSGASPTSIYGIPYHHNSSSTGGTFWMGIDRSNVYTQAVMVNANSSALALPHLRLAVDSIMQNIGIDETEALKSLMWYGHRAQKAAYHEIAFSISTLQKQSGDQNVDLLFAGESIGGIKTKWNIHADPTRLDLLNLDTWGRVEWKEIDYLEIGNNTVFPVYGTSGGVAAAYLFYLITGVQFFVDNPRAVSGITSLALPAGY